MADLSLRARLGTPSKERRFAGEDARQPTDVADPHTLRDETTPTLRERFWTYRWYVLVAFGFVVVLILYLVAVGAQIVPELLSNPFAQLAISHASVFVVAYVVATKRTISGHRKVDWLALVKSDGLELWPGQYVPAGDEERYEKFIPYKGFSLLGHLSKPMTVGDLAPSLARSWKVPDQDLDDPAIVRLDPDFGEHAYTDYGHVLAQLSTGLEADGFGKKSHVVARLPEMADEARMDDLRQQLETQRELTRHYEDLAETMEQQRDNATERARKPLDEAVDQEVQRLERMMMAVRRRTTSIEDVDENVPPIDRELEGLGGEDAE